MGGGKLTCTENRKLQNFDNGNIEKICAEFRLKNYRNHQCYQRTCSTVRSVEILIILKYFFQVCNFISIIFPFSVCFNLPQSWQHCMCDHVLNLYEVIFYSLKTISIFATVVYYGRVA